MGFKVCNCIKKKKKEGKTEFQCGGQKLENKIKKLKKNKKIFITI